MHVAVVGPINVASLTQFVRKDQQGLASAQPSSNVSAPGRIVAALLEQGHRVSVVTHRRGTGQVDLDGDGLTVRQVPSRSNRATQIGSRWSQERRAMASAIRDLAPDVVHSNWTYEAALAGLDSDVPQVASIRDAPFTVVRYDFRPTRMIRLSMALEFRARARRAVLAAPSPYMASAWRRQTRESRPVHVVPNPISTAIEPGSVARSEHPLLVEVADYGVRKNVHGLLQAFALVRRQVPDAELVLVGDGLQEDGDVHRRAKDSNLLDGVRFLGKIPATEVARWMAQAWIHVHAAFEESFGNTLVEAMAVGTPVLGGVRSAAVPWVLGAGSAGVLTDVGDPAVFAASIVDTLRDKVLRERLTQAGLDRVEQSFSPSAVACGFESLYAQALADQRRLAR